MVCKPSGPGVPTDAYGVGMSKDGVVGSLWYLDGTEPGNDGWFTDLAGTPMGTWSYDEGTTLSGTWVFGDGSITGTWMAYESDPYTFIDNTPEDDIFGYEGDSCGTDLPPCAEGLEC